MQAERLEVADEAPPTPTAIVDGTASGPALDRIIEPEAGESSSVSAASLRSRFEEAVRREQPGRSSLRTWVAEIPRDPELADWHVITYLESMCGTLIRLARGRTTAQVRVIIIDMVRDVGTMKFQARDFVIDLLAATLAQFDDERSGMGKLLSRAVASAAIDDAAAEAFVRAAVTKAHERLRKGKRTTTEELIEHGARQSGIEIDTSRRLVELLLIRRRGRRTMTKSSKRTESLRVGGETKRKRPTWISSMSRVAS